MTPTLIITRGLPASGKTAWAKAWVAEDTEHRARVNRDDLRENLYGRPAPLPYHMEQAISAAQCEAVRGLLEVGRSVVVDDTHIRASYIRAWAELASDVGVDFQIDDSFVQVDAAECIRRDERRREKGERHVGEAVILDMAARLKNALAAGSAPEIAPALYEPDPALATAWIVDIDGTLARCTTRSPYDYTRVLEIGRAHV